MSCVSGKYQPKLTWHLWKWIYIPFQNCFSPLLQNYRPLVSLPNYARPVSAGFVCDAVSSMSRADFCPSAMRAADGAREPQFASPHLAWIGCHPGPEHRHRVTWWGKLLMRGHGNWVPGHCWLQSASLRVTAKALSAQGGRGRDWAGAAQSCLTVPKAHHGSASSSPCVNTSSPPLEPRLCLVSF